ncbi:MAG: adenylate/guanylate cyclase domain-containing protein [Pseudomonadota bacterium]
MTSPNLTATRTIMFTDLADYTGRVARTDREGLRRILSDHENAVRPLVEDADGRIVKNIGDSFLCVFPSATDALRVALAIQDHEHKRDMADYIRIAISTGDIEEIDGDVYGSPVNVAARVLELTPAGETWFSHVTRVCMNASEVPWDEVGRFALKGIPEEQDCYRLVPEWRTWLPKRIENAIEARRLVRIGPNESVPHLPSDPVILLENFSPGSDELQRTMRALPVLEAQAFYLAAHTLSTEDRLNWLDAGHGLVIGSSASIDSAIVDHVQATRTHSADTFSLDPESTMIVSRVRAADLELTISGLALPAVPFSQVVESYSYELLPDGRWVTRSSRALMRIQVTRDGVLAHALQPDIAVGGANLAQGQNRTLTEATDIDTPIGQFQFLPTSRYAGVILHDTDMRLALSRGQRGELGRNPGSPGLAFPNRPGQDNIQWCSGPRAEAARANGFTLDRVLAGRQQASVEPTADGVTLTPLHDACPTYVLRDGKLGQAKKAVRIKVHDRIVAGTTVISMRAPT